MTGPSRDFYVAGGTLQRDAPCYVSRDADAALFDALSARCFAYVLTSRQMGKSSLMVRTAARLREQQHAVALVDLTAIGYNVTLEQWYTGLIGVVAEQIGRESFVTTRWNQHHTLGPYQRWQKTISDLVSSGEIDRLVVCIDEIDAVRNLPFSTDEFFAGIREFYNRRGDEPDLRRLNFCLLGVASPADLIRDPRTTPFNVGKRIELHDFSTAEAQALLPGLSRAKPAPSALLERVMSWTGGHPYLTQRLCQAVSEDSSVMTPADVDRCCTDLFLTARARERDDNLLFVRERLLGTGAGVSEVLEVVERVRARRVPDDAQNPWVDLVRLSGITSSRQGTLRIRNKIYERVFSAEWVQSSLPGAERRRQRAAYHRGLWRASLVAAVMISALAVLGTMAFQQRNRAVEQEAANATLLYAAEMNLAQQAWTNGNAGRVLQLLGKNVPSPGSADRRGFEWYYLWRATHAYRRTFDQHTAAVTALDLSRDGRLLVTASWDGLARIWDFRTGQRLLTLEGGEANLLAVAFSRDGSRVITAGTKLRVWDAVSGAAVATLDGHHARISSVALSKDGRVLASAAWDKTIRLWDLNTLRELRTLKGHTKAVNSIAFNPDSVTLVSGAADGTARVWDVATGHSEVLLNNPENAVESVGYSPDGRLIAIAGWLDGVELWDVKSRRLVTRLRGHNGMVSSTSFADDGRTIVTSGLDGTARVWSLPSGTPVRMLTVNDGTAVTVVKMTSSGEFLTGGGNNAAELWHADADQQGEALTVHDAPVSSLAFSPDGQTLATGSWDGQAKLWRIETGAMVTSMPHEGGRVQRVAFSPNGQMLAVGGSEPATEIWDANTGRLIRNLPTAFNALFSPDSHGLIARTAGGVQWWHGDEWLASSPVRHDPDWGLNAIAPDARVIVVGRNDGLMQLWDAATLQVRKTWKAHDNAISAVVFARDSSVTATSSLDGTIKLWRGFELIGTLVGHKGWVNAIAFSPDGKRLASAGIDQTVKIWDVEHLQELMTLSGHRGSVMTLAFSPAGDMLASGGEDRTVRLWRATVLDR